MEKAKTCLHGETASGSCRPSYKSRKQCSNGNPREPPTYLCRNFVDLSVDQNDVMDLSQDSPIRSPSAAPSSPIPHPPSSPILSSASPFSPIPSSAVAPVASVAKKSRKRKKLKETPANGMTKKEKARMKIRSFVPSFQDELYVVKPPKKTREVKEKAPKKRTVKDYDSDFVDEEIQYEPGFDATNAPTNIYNAPKVDLYVPGDQLIFTNTYSTTTGSGGLITIRDSMGNHKHTLKVLPEGAVEPMRNSGSNTQGQKGFDAVVDDLMERYGRQPSAEASDVPVASAVSPVRATTAPLGKPEKKRIAPILIRK